ncbi:MAG: serine/threonine-protein kinase [Proteobacteria bacterium]|nr:serine/threonine-protein kinase [Pseudomonadota bacterium]
MAESNYILGQVIARGGMAEVYRGLHVGQDGFKRLVAIKRILPQFSAHREFVEMFRDEAHIGQRLQHVNVVKVECYDVVEGLPSIVMEFVDGSDLRSILAEIEKSKDVRRMPIPMVLHIIAEAARGLHYAHTRIDDITGRPLEIVHRDISPQNLLVSFNGEVKVTDFGIATADRDFKNTETRAGIVKGKYSYMSPEQISAKKVDSRTDIFALAIVMWEMIAMRRLFSSDNEVEVIEMVKNCKIPGRLSEYNKSITSDLELIVMRGLAKDPQKRFTSMDEFERSIRSHLSKEYPTFNVSDLGNLIKQVHANRHEASQAEIKKMLTSTNLRPSAKSSPIALDLRSIDENSERQKELIVSRKSQSGPRTSPTKAPLSQSGRLSGPANLGYGNSSTAKRNSTQGSKLNQVIAASIAAAIVLLILVKNQSANSAKDILVATLRTSPTPVKIKVNGQAALNNKYLLSPARVKLEKGANIIEVSRLGYITEDITIDTSKDEHKKQIPVIRLKPNANFVPTKFVSSGTKTLQINVKDGFAIGTLTAAKNSFEVKDLNEGPFEVIASEKGKILLRCKLIHSRSGERRSSIVTIDTDRGQCTHKNAPVKERGAK